MRARQARPVPRLPAEHACAAAAGPLVALQDLHRGGLASPVGAEQRHNLPGGDLEADVQQRFQLSVPLAQVLDGDRAHHASPCPWPSSRPGCRELTTPAAAATTKPAPTTTAIAAWRQTPRATRATPTTSRAVGDPSNPRMRSTAVPFVRRLTGSTLRTGVEPAITRRCTSEVESCRRRPASGMAPKGDAAAGLPAMAGRRPGRAARPARQGPRPGPAVDLGAPNPATRAALAPERARRPGCGWPRRACPGRG